MPQPHPAQPPSEPLIGGPAPASTRRLLLVKLGAIGDVIMAIPAAAAMHAEGWQIDWLCSEQVAPILSAYPWIRPIPVEERALLRSGKLETFRALLSLWRRLAPTRYDLVATLYFDRRYRLLTFPVRAARRLLLSHESRAQTLLPGRHHTDEYARILLNRPDGETPFQLAPVPIPNLPPNPIPLTAKPRVVLVPGGARNTLRDDALRRWPLEHYVRLAGLLVEGGCEVVLCGSSTDAWTVPAFAALPFTDAIAKLNLLETLALLQSAAVTVTHDTGPLHVAGLTATGIVALFGPTDPRGRLPQRLNCVALWGGEGFSCRPCYDGRDYAPCAHNGCMEQVTPAMAFAEVQALLALQSRGETALPRIATPVHTPPVLQELVTLVSSPR